MLTVEDLALMLNVHQRTIYRWIEAGRIPGTIKVMGSYRFRNDLIADWLESMKKETVDESGFSN